MDVDIDTLRSWMASHVPDLTGIAVIEKFAGGQSNPTYKLLGPGVRCVLRRKPFGDLLPSAHAIEREYRLISSLYPSGFPVPRPLALCEDTSVIGAGFYLMELVEGRNFPDGLAHGIDTAERSRVYRSMIETLALLHQVDVDAVGLRDFGKPGNYFARQVKRWTTQYRATQTEDLPNIERLIDWLPNSVPEQGRTSITHGDYRIDNLIFDQSSADVVAVLDWELATIGDPLADLSYLLMNWIMPPMGQFGILTDDLVSSGIPSMDSAIAIYCEAADCEELPDLHWYFAYNLFRLAGIAQGIKKRLLDGNASSEKAEESAARVPILSELAWEQARLAGASQR